MALGCTIEEIQMANGVAAASYDVEKNEFSAAVVQLIIPPSAALEDAAHEFAASEEVMESDSWESIALRLGSTAAALQAVNPSVSDLTQVGAVNVPQCASRPRRLTEPLLRPAVATASLLPRTLGEQLAVPEIPSRPKNAEKFPHEYNSTASRFPVTPKQQE